MLCVSCQEDDAGTSQIDAQLANGAPNGREQGSRQQQCERCGAELGGSDSADIMIRKLSQLETFGLASGARPVLEPKEPSSICAGPEKAGEGSKK